MEFSITFTDRPEDDEFLCVESHIITEQLKQIDSIIGDILKLSLAEGSIVSLMALHTHLVDLVSQRGDLLLTKRRMIDQSSKTRAALASLGLVIEDIRAQVAGKSVPDVQGS